MDCVWLTSGPKVSPTLHDCNPMCSVSSYNSSKSIQLNGLQINYISSKFEFKTIEGDWIYHLSESLALFLFNASLLLLLLVNNWSNWDILKSKIKATNRHCMGYVWLTSGPKDGRFGMLSGVNSE